MKWSFEECNLIVETLGGSYDLEGFDASSPFDFEGNILCKDGVNDFRVRSWDGEEIYFKGSLKLCLTYIKK